MNSEISKSLLTLSELDTRILIFLAKKQQIEEDLQKRRTEIETHKKELARIELEYQEYSSRQTLEETKLKEEEKKIIERRKQLSSMGGIKVAKYTEREIDISTRAVKSLEERALQAIVEVDRLQLQSKELKEKLEQLELDYEVTSSDQEQEKSGLEIKAAELSIEREKLFAALDLRLQRLYDRIYKRYPNGAVAKAENGSCFSCSRALPPQTYNQILAGNALIQCPGCSRILVNVPQE